MGFISLYTAYSGLSASQVGMDTASHNVANAGTEGYSRQSVELAARRPYLSPLGLVGNGVDVVDIRRARDEFLDARVRSGSSGFANLTTLGRYLDDLEAVTGEPDAGITNALTGVFTSFEQLALDPTDSAARLGVLGSLDALTARVRSISQQWTQSGEAAKAELTGSVDEVNRLLHQVANLNQSILETGGDRTPPNDLLDARDLALDRLAEITGATSRVDSNGSARVSLGGLALVSGVTVSEITFDAGTGLVGHSSGATVRAGGEIGGYQTFIDTELPAVQSRLDAFVADLAAALNAQHAAGYAPDGSSGAPLLTYSAGAPSATLQVAVTDPQALAASGSTGVPFPAFDGTNAQALADLRTVLVAAGGTDTLGGSVRALVGDLASRTAATRSGAASQSSLLEAASMSRMQANGVSIDEEMVHLITYQRAYEAAARVMTTVDQSLDTLINRTGIVGR